MVLANPYTDGSAEMVMNSINSVYFLTSITARL